MNRRHYHASLFATAALAGLALSVAAVLLTTRPGRADALSLTLVGGAAAWLLYRTLRGLTTEHSKPSPAPRRGTPRTSWS